MKAYTDKLKKIIATTSLALIATTAPMWAQDAQNSQAPQDRSTIQVNEPRVQTTDSSFSTSSSPQMSESDNRMEGAVIEEPAGADNENNWSWIGLLGLLGLFGLKRRHDVHDEHYRPVRA